MDGGKDEVGKSSSFFIKNNQQKSIQHLLQTHIFWQKPNYCIFEHLDCQPGISTLIIYCLSLSVKNHQVDHIKVEKQYWHHVWRCHLSKNKRLWSNCEIIEGGIFISSFEINQVIVVYSSVIFYQKIYSGFSTVYH